MGNVSNQGNSWHPTKRYITALVAQAFTINPKLACTCTTVGRRFSFRSIFFQVTTTVSIFFGRIVARSLWMREWVWTVRVCWCPCVCGRDVYHLSWIPVILKQKWEKMVSDICYYRQVLKKKLKDKKRKEKRQITFVTLGAMRTLNIFVDCVV